MSGMTGYIYVYMYILRYKFINMNSYRFIDKKSIFVKILHVSQGNHEWHVLAYICVYIHFTLQVHIHERQYMPLHSDSITITMVLVPFIYPFPIRTCINITQKESELLVEEQYICVDILNVRGSVV